MNAPPEIAVVIVSYNTRDLLLEALTSVTASAQGIPIEIVVVDNHSADGSAAAARQAFPQAAIIENTENRGFGAACNQAIRATASPLILLLNSDARLTAEALEAMTDCMRRSDRCGAAGCRMTDAAGHEVTSTRNFLTPFNQTLELAGVKFGPRRFRRAYLPRPPLDCSVDWIDGACLLLNRKALDEVGLFDEQFFMYSEDEDLCLRLKQRGWQVCYTAAGTAIHHGGASSAQARLEMLRQFYYSQMLFLLKHRGRLSVTLYAAGVRAVLTLKRLLRFGRGEDLAERLDALRRAYRQVAGGNYYRGGRDAPPAA